MVIFAARKSLAVVALATVALAASFTAGAQTSDQLQVSYLNSLGTATITSTLTAPEPASGGSETLSYVLGTGTVYDDSTTMASSIGSASITSFTSGVKGISEYTLYQPGTTTVSDIVLLFTQNTFTDSSTKTTLSNAETITLVSDPSASLAASLLALAPLSATNLGGVAETGSLQNITAALSLPAGTFTSVQVLSAVPESGAGALLVAGLVMSLIVVRKRRVR